MQPVTQSVPNHPPVSGTLRVVLWILIFIAGAEFVTRGPGRYLAEPSNWNDLSQNYTTAKLWLKGQSPSDPRNFVALWKQEGHSRLGIEDVRTHMAPPPGGLVVLAPIAALPWRVAKIVWLVILLISFAATVWALASTSGFRRNETRTLIFVAACLALAPFQTGIASGNTSILVIGLCVVAIWAARQNRDATAGILFGIACAIKPQLGAFLVLYYLVRRRWKLFATAVSCTAALTIVAIGYLALSGVTWLQDYVHNARGLAISNPIDDFTPVNPSRFTLINLQVPFFSMTASRSSANLLALTVVALLVLVWIYFAVRNNGHALELLSLGAISVVALLPFYHRFYDAGILTVPLSWCIASAVGPSKTVARVALLMMTTFLAPGTAFLQLLAIRGRFPDGVTHSWWWEVLVMSHEAWALLLLFLVLLYGMRSVSSEDPTAHG